MKLPGRISAGIEILEAILYRHRSAADALKDWGGSHRFAGTTDRAVIGNMVYDALRQRNSAAALAGSETARAIILATLRQTWHLELGEIADAAAGQYGPGALSDDEQSRLARPTFDTAPLWVAGNIPQWLEPHFESAFGSEALNEALALCARAPVDVRANTLKADQAKILKALAKFGAVPAPLAPNGVRIPPPRHDQKSPNIEAEPAHARGWFEVQDAGSQVAAALANALPGEQVADICAGGGGKTLALAAAMQNKGQIHAYDLDRHRLRPIFDRLKRAGAHNVQVIPADQAEKLSALEGKLDLVLVDAPCSGSGAWRRKPDAKWRFSEQALQRRIDEQRGLLRQAAGLVRPGGRVVYVTCSVLRAENNDQTDEFLDRNPQFRAKAWRDIWSKISDRAPPPSADTDQDNLLLTPARHETDGFFIATLERAAS